MKAKRPPRAAAAVAADICAELEQIGFTRADSSEPNEAESWQARFTHSLRCVVASVVPLRADPEFVTVNLVGRLGRLHRGYARGVLWLGQLRGHASVGLRLEPGIVERRELVLGSTWIQRRDPRTLHHHLGLFFNHYPLADELAAVTYPELALEKEILFHEWIAEQFGKDGRQEVAEFIGAALANPNVLLRVAEERETEAAAMFDDLLPRAARWLRRWDLLERFARLRLSDDPNAREAGRSVPCLEMLALARLKLGHPAETLAVLHALGELGQDLDATRLVALRQEALFALGRVDALVDAIPDLDSDVGELAAKLVLLRWKALALARLNRRDEAREEAERYIEVAGKDMVFLGQLKALFQAKDESGE